MTQPTPDQPATRYVHDPVECQQVAESRRLILAVAEQARPGRAAVLGAGHCAEIPLAGLVERFERVLVNDSSEAALHEGLANAHLGNTARAKLDVQIADLTGSSEAILANLAQAIADSSHADDAIERMARVTDAAPLAGLPLDGQFDLIVASCVLSQLHFRVLSGAYEIFGERYPQAQNELRQSLRWTAAMYDLARRMEHKFIDDLLGRLAPGGFIYLSDSAQMCYVTLTPEGKWETEGTHRLLRSQNLGDYLDDRFFPVARERWHWVDSPPAQTGETGRLYDVQALVLRAWRM